MKLGRRITLLGVAATTCLGAQAPSSTIRIGTLRYGSVAWELDVMRTHGLIPAGATETVEFAAGPATQVALQAGRVDVIVQDWLWVARQRSDGAGWTLAPSSGAVGALMAPGNSPILTVADLPGRRLGIAGSPLDKSWLILRALGKKTLGIDLDARVEKTFGPPPLLAQLLESGRLDAVLTYWPFAAKAEATGQRRVLSIEDAVAALGISGPAPFLGYVFSERWARENMTAISGFLDAAAAARTILLSDDAEWVRLQPLTGAGSAAELISLRDWYRRGVPRSRSVTDQGDAERLYEILAGIGGSDLVGSATTLPAGTFWTG